MPYKIITDLIKKIKILVKESISKHSINSLLEESKKLVFNYYFFILQKRMLYRHKFISNIKKNFSRNLKDINYKILVPRNNISFTESELRFLDQEISCSKIIKKKAQYGYNQREVFICELRDIKFFGHSGCVSYDNHPLLDTACSIYRLYSPIRSVDSVFLKHKNMKGSYTSIIHIHKNNFYHWLIESIPRFYGISKINEKKINLIIPRKTPQWQYEILKIFLDKRFNLVYIKENEVWELEKFYFSSFFHIDCSGYIPQKMLNFVKNKVFNYYNIDNTIKNKRILISRNKKGSRKLLNEDEVMSLLEKYNFEKVHPEELPYKEQVELFSSASIIVAVSGAALSNLIFAENLKIVLFYNPKLIGTHFLLMSKALGFTHKYIIGENINKNLDLRVNILELEKIIKELLSG